MPNHTAPPQRTHTQQDLVRALIRYIQTEGLATGDRLPPIRALAEQFEVTSSAIRDAQIQLQTMGMIKILPRSGAFVQSVSLEPLVGAMTDTLDNALMQADPSLFHLLDARQLIEVECAVTAARRRRIGGLAANPRGACRDARRGETARRRVVDRGANGTLRCGHAIPPSHRRNSRAIRSWPRCCAPSSA